MVTWLVLGEVIAFCKLINTMSYFIIGVGYLVILIVLVCGFTVFPRWLAIFSPGVLFLLMPLLRKLPKGLHMIICGGWSNLISVIYYTVAIVVYFTVDFSFTNRFVYCVSPFSCDFIVVTG